MYRFLFTARWLGFAALAVALATAMVFAGRWQLDRYHDRSATNARIDAARTATPTPLRDAVAAPGGPAGTTGPGVRAAVEWSRVVTTGRYDPDQEILVRGRTRDGQVGFEVLTPLRMADGSAVLIDRGWTPTPTGDATTHPRVPQPPSGEVTVAGRIVRSESGSGRLERINGRMDVRRISIGQIATELPYPLFGSYVLLDQDQPGGDGLAAVPSRRENAWLNAGYVVQWWIFAGLTLIGFGWLVRREATDPPKSAGESARAW